jgi:alpha-L-fucosidase
VEQVHALETSTGMRRYLEIDRDHSCCPSLHHRTAFIWAIVILMGTLPKLGNAQQPNSAELRYQPSKENLIARTEFQDAKFGMFIHWGLYSVLGDGEWVFHDRKLTVAQYDLLPKFFDPQKFDAKAWVALAKLAGMKYITITARHHDGFAMFDSKVSDWNIVQRTPYARDPLKRLADECHRQGLKLFFYYSQLDWHNPDYYPRGRTAWDNGRPDQGDWNSYIDDYMDAQLRELLTNYGPVGGIWFDGMWDKPKTDWHLQKTYALIHQLQPAALIIPNHHETPKPGEDVQTFEKDLPGQNTAGFNTGYVTDRLPLESSNTINDSWGFNIGDHNFKSPPDLEEMLVRAAGNNSNLLLNIGPMPNGEIQEEFVTRLHEIGTWTSRYGDTIYGTRGGPISPADWGVTTQKDNRIYVHILHWAAPLLSLPPITEHIDSAHEFITGNRLEFKQDSSGIVLHVPSAVNGEVDRVIVLALKRTL